MKFKIVLLIIVFISLVSFASARDFIPYGDINMKNVLEINNVTNLKVNSGNKVFNCKMPNEITNGFIECVSDRGSSYLGELI